MTEHDLIYAIALQNTPRIGATTAKKLISYCGSAERVLKSKKHSLLNIDGIGEATIKSLFDKHYLDEAEKEIQFIKDHGITVLYFTESDYPERLKECLDGPIVLFQKGNINLQNKHIISIVGTRKITTSGIAFCQKLIEQLTSYNPIIVSGFAYGTDITAQKAAIKNNLQTIGCLAHGFDQMYPKAHKKYVKDIEAYGGFYTDFSSNAPFERNNFLKRNRIIAGLSEATIVVESAEKGGSLVTADIANSYNREVFAVPGRTTDSQSVGCNNLIKSQRAHLLSDPLDIPYLLNWQLKDETKPPVQKQLFVELNSEEQKIYSYLNVQGKMLLDSIAIDCNIPSYKAASVLLNMELKGVIRPLPGKLFELA